MRAAAVGNLPKRASVDRIPTVDVLGVRVSAVNINRAIATMERWIALGSREYVCVSGVHGIIESQDDPQLLAIHNNAGLVVPDGRPLSWIGRASGHRGMSQCRGADLMLDCCRASVERGYRHYLYGGAEGVPELLAEKLRERFPALHIVGTYSPPFRPLTPEEDVNVVNMINDAKPDFVWVGLSTPKQERWMASHVGRLTAPALLGVGAAFDFHAGLKTEAPRWMHRFGLEWLFRMLAEPRRLGPRYLVNNPRFVVELARQLCGLRRKPEALALVKGP